MNKSPIAWIQNPDGSMGSSWNPIAGCSVASVGCENCYAKRLVATRFARNPKLPMYHGLARVSANGEPQWTGVVKFLHARLDQPLRTRKGTRIFTCDMSDLFHEKVTNEQIAAVFSIMSAAPQHEFYVLTKRAKRMREWFEWVEREAATCNAGRGMPVPARLLVEAQHFCSHGALRHTTPIIEKPWPLPNVRIGVSVENQAAAEERIPHLLKCPAAVRFLSCEPMLDAVDLSQYLTDALYRMRRAPRMEPDWIIVGGESGPRARPFHAKWARSIIAQCERAHVPCFVKQLGSRPRIGPPPDYWDYAPMCDCDAGPHKCAGAERDIKFRDLHGGDPAEWPEDIRVREWPEVP